MKLSILMPVYNEAQTIRSAVERVLAVEYPCEIELVLVDDGSTDGSAKAIAELDDLRVSPPRIPSTKARAWPFAPPPNLPPVTT